MSRLPWENYNWSQFEKICFQYLKCIYSSRFYKLTHTPKKKDGGKDIVVEKRDRSFVAWGECKDHTRSIDLSVIGKNIVLALSHRIQKAIIFSVSPVTINTKIEILNVAQSHGFDVLFLDGELLDLEILRCATVAMRYFPESYFEYQACRSMPLLVHHHISEYEFASNQNYEVGKRQYQLRNGANIFIHVFLKNLCATLISEIRIELRPKSGKLLFFSESQNISRMNPYTDITLSFCGIALIPDTAISLPEIKITYCHEGENYTQEVDLGEINTADVWICPFIGEKVNQFLNTSIENLFYVIEQRYTKCIYINGPSGTGKSRLAHEIKNKGLENGYRAYLFDFPEYDDSSIICYLFNRILSLPTLHGKISNIDRAEFSDILSRYQCTDEESECLFDFLFLHSTNTSYAVLAQLFCKIVMNLKFHEQLIVLFDNVQNASEDSQVFLWGIATGLKDLEAGTLLVFTARTESKTTQNNIIINYLNAELVSACNSYVSHFNCTLLKENDAESMFKHLLHLGEENELVVRRIIERIGCRPIDILLLAKSIAEESGILQTTNGYSRIGDPLRLNSLMLEIPKRLEGVIERRLHSGSLNDNRLDRIIALTKLFSGKISCNTLMKLGYDPIELDRLTMAMILKYDPVANHVSFFHYTIEAIVAKSIRYIPSVDDLQKIASIAKEQDASAVIVPQDTYFYTLVYLHMTNEACIVGKNALAYYQAHKEFKKALTIANTLLVIKGESFDLNTTFDIMLTRAELVMSLLGVEQGRIAFKELHPFVLQNISRIETKQLHAFYHKFANSKLHNMLYREAIIVLDEFGERFMNDDSAKMIIEDRLCVAYFSLGNLEKALEHIDRVISLATGNRDAFWLSTAYSDKAFSYFVNTEEKKVVCDLFDMVKQTHEQSGVAYDYRRIEVLVQTALKRVLESAYSNANEIIGSAINIAKETSNMYLLVPALNLQAFIYVKQGEYNLAISTLQESLSCAVSFSLEKSIVAIYSSLGNIAMLQTPFDKETALRCYTSAESAVSKVCSSDASIRFHPCIASMIKAYLVLGYPEKSEAIFSAYNFPRLATYYNSCNMAESLQDDDSITFGNLTHKGYSFIY